MQGVDELKQWQTKDAELRIKLERAGIEPENANCWRNMFRCMIHPVLMLQVIAHKASYPVCEEEYDEDDLI